MQVVVSSLLSFTQTLDSHRIYHKEQGLRTSDAVARKLLIFYLRERQSFKKKFLESYHNTPPMMMKHSIKNCKFNGGATCKNCIIKENVTCSELFCALKLEPDLLQEDGASFSLALHLKRNYFFAEKASSF